MTDREHVAALCADLGKKPENAWNGTVIAALRSRPETYAYLCAHSVEGAMLEAKADPALVEAMCKKLERMAQAFMLPTALRIRNTP
jgi:hypothetical protein